LVPGLGRRPGHRGDRGGARPTQGGRGRVVLTTMAFLEVPAACGWHGRAAAPSSRERLRRSYLPERSPACCYKCASAFPPSHSFSPWSRPA